MAKDLFIVNPEEVSEAVNDLFGFTDYLNQFLTAVEEGRVSEKDKHFGIISLFLPQMVLDGLRRRMMDIIKAESNNLEASIKGRKEADSPAIKAIPVQPSKEQS